MFAIMMYMLGFLLLAIPLPKASGLKRYARRLMHDSFNLVLTIFILNVFLTIVLSWQDVVWCAIWGTQTNQCGIVGIEAFQKNTYELVAKAQKHNVDFVNNIGFGVQAAVTVGQIVTALATGNLWGVPLAFYYGARAGAMAAGQTSYILGPVSSLYGLALILQSFLLYYVEFIYKNWGVLSALGILLCVFPFNIGRRAGFFLVAFPVASYVIIPLHAFIGPIIAENVAGFTAGMGWSIVESYVSPQIVGLAAIPAMYFTFTAFAMSGLAALTGASSIPLRGLSTSVAGLTRGLVDEGKRVIAGTPEAKQAGMGGFSAGRRTAGMIQGEIRGAKAGGRVIRFDRWLEGKTVSGEKVRVPVEMRRTAWGPRYMRRHFGGYHRMPVTEWDIERLREGPSFEPSRLRKGDLVYPSTVRTRSSEAVDVERMIAEGRMKYRESLLPHIRPRQGFKWGRDDAFTKTGEEYRRQKLLKAAERRSAEEQKELERAHGLREEEPTRKGLAESLRSAYAKFALSTAPAARPLVERETVIEAGGRKYDADERVRALWRQHTTSKGEELHFAEPQLRDTFAKTYAAWQEDVAAVDRRHRHFFDTHGKYIAAVEVARVGRKPLVAATHGCIYSSSMEQLRQTWVDDLSDAMRQHTDVVVLEEKAADPNKKGRNPPVGAYNKEKRRVTAYKANQYFATPKGAHYVMSHETGHGVFDGFVRYTASEFTKANTGGQLDNSYIAAHPEELGRTYEKVALVPQDLTKAPLRQVYADWAEGKKARALRTLFEGTGWRLDEEWKPSEHHLEFHFAAPTAKTPTGVTVYRHKLSGEAQAARERLRKFNSAIAETEGVTRYAADHLRDHAEDNFIILKELGYTYVDQAVDENFAECTRLFTSANPKQEVGVRAELTDADLSTAQATWQGIMDFMEARRR
jgi:hypothetical protein